MDMMQQHCFTEMKPFRPLDVTYFLIEKKRRKEGDPSYSWRWRLPGLLQMETGNITSITAVWQTLPAKQPTQVLQERSSIRGIQQFQHLRRLHQLRCVEQAGHTGFHCLRSMSKGQFSVHPMSKFTTWRGSPNSPNFQEFGNLHGLIHLRKSSYSKIWQAPVQLRVESQLFLHMTCHFDGSKLHSTPSPGSVSPQISPMKTWIRTWGQPPTCWKHAGGMKSGLAAKARRCCSFNASSQVRSSETENSDSSTWAHGGGHFSWQRPLLKKCLVQMELQRKTKKKHSHFPTFTFHS